MSFDPWQQWLVPLAAFFAGVALVLVTWLARAYTERRRAWRAVGVPVRKNAGGSVVNPNSVSSGAAPATSAEAARSAAEQIPHEWDGAPLRPNLTRQITLGGGLR